MRILYLHQYFKTPEDGGIIRSYYLAKALIAEGHEVVMVTGNPKPRYEKRNFEGMQVHYLPVTYDPAMGFLRRCWSFARFAWKSYRFAKNLGDFDKCFATSTPLTVGWTARRLLKKKRLPYIFEVRDLWPEAAIQIGAVKQGWLKALLYKMEATIYADAQKIVALSPGMRDYIEGIVDRSKIQLISNISDCDYFQPTVRQLVQDEKFGLQGEFTVTYIGAFGVSNHVEYLLDVATEAQKQGLSKLKFLFAGKGPQYHEIVKMAADRRLQNVEFFGFLDKEGVRELLSVTDAVYTTFSQVPVLSTNSPNKFFDGLAAGKLSIVNTDGWLKEIVEQRNCGFYTDPNHPKSCVESLKEFMDSSLLLLQYQRSARAAAEQFFSRKIQSRRFTWLFEKESELTPLEDGVYILTA